MNGTREESGLCPLLPPPAWHSAYHTVDVQRIHIFQMLAVFPVASLLSLSQSSTHRLRRMHVAIRLKGSVVKTTVSFCFKTLGMFHGVLRVFSALGGTSPGNTAEECQPETSKSSMSDSSWGLWVWPSGRSCDISPPWRVLATHLSSSLLLLLGTQWRISPVLGPPAPVWDTRMEPLVSAWPSLGYCSHLGNETVVGKDLCLPFK